MRRQYSPLRYAKVRFEWKKALNKSPELSGGAKLLATMVCDTYVNQTSGMFWPKNETMAACLGKSIRSVQRHLRELEEAGWIERVRKWRVRRAYRICFPKPDEGDSEHDTGSEYNVTNLAHEGDTVVTPYKNQLNNKTKVRPETMHHSYIQVQGSEALSLEVWRPWIREHIEIELDALFAMLKKNDAYFLPARFPDTGLERNHKAFFERVVATNGKCFEN
jgi:DNA-binding transcriptional ArsR family regulator